jgi:hypothetical protein
MNKIDSYTRLIFQFPLAVITLVSSYIGEQQLLVHGGRLLFHFLLSKHVNLCLFFCHSLYL